MPLEVQLEISSGARGVGKEEFRSAGFLTKRTEKVSLSRLLENTLDLGETAVIQTAMDLGIDTVCIDEAVGRRIARLHGLKLTGSVGILIAAKNTGMKISVRESILRMRYAGIWLSDRVASHALNLSNEGPLL